MKELPNIPPWGIVLCVCVAVASTTFLAIGLFHALAGAGTTQVLFVALIAGALALGAWSVPVRGNPALSRHSEGPPNRRSPLD